MRTRNRCIYIRMTDNEYALLMEQIKLSGHTIQSYMINAALNGHISSREEVEELRNLSKYLEDMDKQLRGMGNNCNQMAHLANINGILPTEEKLKYINNKINQLKTEVALIWQSIRQSISRQKLMGQ